MGGLKSFEPNIRERSKSFELNIRKELTNFKLYGIPLTVLS